MEIRYRAYDTKRGCWVYWDDLAVSPICPTYEDSLLVVWQSEAPDGRLGTHGEVEGIVFQLSTYQHDSNGREIYVGDIVKDTWQENNPYGYSPDEWDDCERKYEVEFKDGNCNLDHPRSHEQCCVENFKREIIGNIFEKPQT